MPYVKRTAAGRISAVFDRPSRDAKERVRNNDPELLKFLGLAPTQSVVDAAPPAPLEPVEYVTEAPEPDADFPVETQAYETAFEEEEIYDDASYEIEESPFIEPVTDDVNEPADGAQVQTDFSLPDDMPEEIAEPDLFDDPFDTPAHDATMGSSNAAMEELPDAPVFEAGDMPAQTAAPPPQPQPAPAQATPAPASPKPEQKPVASAAPPPAAQPETPETDADDKDGAALRQLDASDMEMARITEDLIDLLIGRNIINFTDFPNMAQAKLINRRALRSNMSALTNLVSDEENIF